jgi:hypothetical protein
MFRGLTTYSATGNPLALPGVLAPALRG